ncbi:MAG: hypothetical protein WBR26_24455 [Candidatus Acidiferrum sp.]
MRRKRDTGLGSPLMPYDDRISISREELYEKVWTTPMQKLALRFGLSDVGLAKLCRRHQIPVPGRGYWARLQVGQKPKRPVLPNAVVNGIEIVPREKQQAEDASVMPDRPVPVIEISEDRQIANRHVIRIDKSVLRGKKDERGLPLTRQGRNLPVHVSLESLPRALRILDALFTALDSAGFNIEWVSPYASPLNVLVLNEKIGVSISEKIERKQHKITPDEISRQKVDRWWAPPRWDYMRTGKLKFVLQSAEASPLQHTWTDGKKQKLENCVGEIFVCFEATANALKKYREDCAEVARQRAKEEKRAAERRQQEAEYNRKFEVVNKFAQKWRVANELREFATALKESVWSPAVAVDQKLGILRILDWIERHANYLDPLTDVSQVIQQFEKRPSLWG